MMKATRNLIAVGLLWASASVAAPVHVRADYCDPPNYMDHTDDSGQCAPGGQDACGYFSNWCFNDCFATHYGGFCRDDFYLCQEHNAGSDDNPQYCLDEGFCDCYYDY